MYRIHIIPVMQDNYIWAIEFGDHQVAIIDPGVAKPASDYIEQQQLELAALLITHGCWDHISGIGEMLKYKKVPVYGPTHDRVPHLDHALVEGDIVPLGELELKVLDTPGHRKGHISFYGDDMLFCGDAIFSAGCGKLHDGSFAQSHASLNKISQLPNNTHLYCAHEYTADNLRFAAMIEPGNQDIQHYADKVKTIRAEGKATIPTTVGLERKINPFLRHGEPEVKASAERWIGHPLHGGLEIFTALRKWKSSLA